MTRLSIRLTQVIEKENLFAIDRNVTFERALIELLDAEVRFPVTLSSWSGSLLGYRVVHLRLAAIGSVTVDAYLFAAASPDRTVIPHLFRVNSNEQGRRIAEEMYDPDAPTIRAFRERGMH